MGFIFLLMGERSQTRGESEHNRSCQIAEFDAFFGENLPSLSRLEVAGQAICKKPQFLLSLFFSFFFFSSLSARMLALFATVHSITKAVFEIGLDLAPQIA